MTAAPTLHKLPPLADLDADAAVGGAVQMLRGVLAGGTPGQTQRAAEMICRVWMAAVGGGRDPVDRADDAGFADGPAALDDQ